MNVPLTLTAKEIGTTFEVDSELALPRYPKFINEIQVIPYGATSLLFEGGHGTQVLGGRAARSLIPRIIPLLDGRTTIAELEQKLTGLPRGAIPNIVALLYSRGLLEDGVGWDNEVAEIPGTSAFFGRYTDVTRVNKNRCDALKRLQSSTVLVCCPTSLQSTFEAAFEGSGLGSVNFVDLQEPIYAPANLLLACFDETVGAENIADFMQQAWDHKMPTLHARFAAGNVEMGPFFIPNKSASYEDFRAIHPMSQGGAGYSSGFWAASIAHQALLILSRVGRTNFYNRCHYYEYDNNERYYKEIAIARMPGVGSGELAKVCATQMTKQIWRQHSSANDMPTSDLLSPRDYQMHYAPANINIAKSQPEPYWGATPYALPEPSLAAIEPSWQNYGVDKSSLDKQAVATLLGYTFGYQHFDNGEARRIVPSAGGLGSNEAFILVNQVDGLDTGVYHYFASEHRLDRIGAVNREVVAGALGVDIYDLPPLVLVTVGHLNKVRQKYGDFGFRFINLDTGFTQVTLFELLSQLNLPFALLEDTRDIALANALSLPVIAARNAITSVVAIGVAEKHKYMHPCHVNRAMDSLLEGAANSGLDSYELEARYRAQRDKALIVKQATPTYLHDLLLTRRSVRVFANRTVPLELVADVAHQVDKELQFYQQKGALEAQVDIYAALKTESGSGEYTLYRYNSKNSHIELLEEHIAQPKLKAGILQNNLASAPVVYFFTGRFHDAVQAYKHRGYRTLIQHAAAASAKTLLYSQSFGLVGCPWGGLCEDGVGHLLGIDRYTEMPLFGTSMGYAHD
ncbi:nitroreductase family protein [Pseudoalteromonas rubra]|uniref:Nitroreductase domain-containing protein n=1 Tax=Pseudoalteromonas rubra TaxID=43658 RepID=A0A0F4QW18_9GAMM|nr:nitroreductase family protein [Pseudoalteromonas rubra]KJZ11435.1 hypothetical protein TW77_06050 [Pseudoalteromonas rubra]